MDELLTVESLTSWISSVLLSGGLYLLLTRESVSFQSVALQLMLCGAALAMSLLDRPTATAAAAIPLFGIGVGVLALQSLHKGRQP